MAFSAAIFICCACIAVAFFLWMKMRRPKDYPPGPPRWPLIGNLVTAYRAGKFATQFRRWADEYGPICSVKMGQHDAVIISDFDIAKEALAREALADRPILFQHKMFTKYKNVGLINCNGKSWRENRRFTLRNLRDFGFGKSSLESVIMDELKELAHEIRPDPGLAKDVPNVAVLDAALNAAVTNVIWWLMARKRVSKNDAEFVEILKILDDLLKYGIIEMLSLFPSLNPFDPPPSLFRLVSNLGEQMDYLYEYMQRVLEEHRATLDENEPRDLVDAYLLQQRKNSEEDPDHHLTDDMIKATLIDLFIAGAETTSTTLRWLFLHLICQPEVQRKVQEELDRVVGRDRAPSIADHDKMPYTTAVTWEVWRCVTIVPVGLNRRAAEDIQIGKFKIPKNTIVMTLIQAMHHNPETFPDPQNFRPERFLDESGALKENAKIMPFQAGRRQCPGESLARMNTFLGAAYLLQIYNFDKVPGETYDLRPRDESQILNLPRPFKVLVTPRF